MFQLSGFNSQGNIVVPLPIVSHNFNLGEIQECNCNSLQKIKKETSFTYILGNQFKLFLTLNLSLDDFNNLNFEKKTSEFPIWVNFKDGCVTK